MSPIRVGLIGLSTSTVPTQPGMWASSAHLPSILASPHYELVALCNSTVRSAEASITFHSLGSSVKAYGSPEDLAQDPNVDLVVVSVEVGKHYMLTKPALLAGKDVFIEWPLGSTTAEAEYLSELAKEKRAKTMLGLQARAGPIVAAIRKVLDSGRIGRVMSTTVVGTFAGIPVDKFPTDAAYYMDIKSGGNVLTIQLGHFIDTLALLLGEPVTLHSHVATQYPTIALFDRANNVVEPNHPKSAPDHITLHGTLASHAIFNITFRSTPHGSIDGKGLHWLITGTDGEMEIVMPEMQWQLGPHGTTIRVRSKNSAEAEEVFVGGGIVESEEEYVGKVQFPGTNTARLYEAFAKGRKEEYADFEDGLVRHKMLDAIIKAGM